MSRPKVLVLCTDVIAERMAGVGIRAYEIARALQPVADVTLAGVETDRPPVRDLPVVQYHIRDASALRPHIAAADVVVAQPQWPVVARWLRRSGARLVYDMYDPEPFETLEFLSDRSSLLRRTMHTLTVDRYLEAFRDGHFFLCASAKQRDLWLGMLLAERLIDPALYDRDPSMLGIMDAVPFGVGAEPPRAGDPPDGPRQRFPALGDDAEIVLWNGGIWNWLDAPTAVRAAGLLAERRPRAKLVFMGASTVGPAKRATDETRALAADLGLLDRVVFFNEDWIAYDRRGEWLLQADCAVSTHVDHLETRFAFRTRLLDCFWAGLPVVCTQGDDLAERVAREGLGAAVPQRDPVALAAALEGVLDVGRDHYAPAIAAAAADFAWPRVVEPLTRFVLDPSRGAGGPLAGSPSTRLAQRPGHRARAAGYVAARGTLNALGLREWPQL